MSFISEKRSFQNRNIVLLTFNFYSKCTLSCRKDGHKRKAFSLSFLLIPPPPFFFWHDRTKTKAEAFTFKKPQQEKRAQETFEASSSPSPTNWWAKNARGDDVLTEPTTHRRKRIQQVSRVCWDCVDVDHFWCWRLEWANQRAQSTIMLWQLNPFYISKAD